MSHLFLVPSDRQQGGTFAFTCLSVNFVSISAVVERDGGDLEFVENSIANKQKL